MTNQQATAVRYIAVGVISYLLGFFTKDLLKIVREQTDKLLAEKEVISAVS